MTWRSGFERSAPLIFSARIALPYIVFRRPERSGAIARTILEDLDSENDAACASAAKALRHWIHLARTTAAPKPPPDSFMKLLERVIFRRKPGILSCLREITYLVVEAPEVITSDQASLLIGSLMPWHFATVLPDTGGEANEFYEAERPELRAFVGSLAGALAIWWKKCATDETEPKPLKFWRESCASEAMPEIRRAFTTWD